MQFVTPQRGAITILLEDGLLGLLNHHRLEVEIGCAVEPSSSTDILAEVLVDIFFGTDVPLGPPTFDGCSPGTDDGRDMIDWLA